MAVTLSDFRQQLDQITEETIQGLAMRSAYLLNRGVFGHEKPTHFDKALRTVMSRQNILFRNTEQQKKLIEVIQFYQCILPSLCAEFGEQADLYERVARIDAENVVLQYRRIYDIGNCIAEVKLEREPSLISADRKEIRQRIQDPAREERVINHAIELAQTKYDLPKPQLVRYIFRTLIDFTVAAQVDYIRKRTAFPQEAGAV